MAHEKNHDYHIIDPSPWPFLAAASGFTMLAGSVLWFHGYGPWLAIIGFLGVAYTMYVWWADVVHESPPLLQDDDTRTSSGRRNREVAARAVFQAHILTEPAVVSACHRAPPEIGREASGRSPEGSVCAGKPRPQDCVLGRPPSGRIQRIRPRRKPARPGSAR